MALGNLNNEMCKLNNNHPNHNRNRERSIINKKSKTTVKKGRKRKQTMKCIRCTQSLLKRSNFIVFI